MSYLDGYMQMIIKQILEPAFSGNELLEALTFKFKLQGGKLW